MNISSTIQCPLCNDAVDRLLYRFHLDNERRVIGQIKKEHPDWSENDGACGRCVDYYQTEVVMMQRMLPEIGPYFPVKSADDFIILPTGLRLDADSRYTGNGVTICFIDSGFFMHPDLICYRNRVKAVIDITNPCRNLAYFNGPHPESWHGTMTSVVCAGDGYRSNGLYKGIASEADLVLLKVQDDEGRITTANIVAALQWVLDHYTQYNIRVVNLSVADDLPVSYKESAVDQLAEQLIGRGIVVVAAVGNDDRGSIKPPANSLNVIAVGGINDENSLGSETEKLYHSSFGKTIDQFMKPELLAHAIWIAAPILPGTKEEQEATVLYELLQLKDDELEQALRLNSSCIKLNESVYGIKDVVLIRQYIIRRIQEAKYIRPEYMHVDGTSFAAPIVSAIIAQMLEANPALTPAMVREVLFSTARRIANQPAEKQGYGLIQPRKAVMKVLRREVFILPDSSPQINRSQNTIRFYVQNDLASQIAVCGSFNHWATDVLLMEPGKHGVWKIDIPMLPPGRYLYKFFTDSCRWMEDSLNPYREPDGFNGFNSILMIEPTLN